MSETSALVEAQALPLHDRARQHCRGTLVHRLRATPNAGDRAGGAPTTHTDYSQRTACLRWAAWPAERARKPRPSLRHVSSLNGDRVANHRFALPWALVTPLPSLPAGPALLTAP